MSEPFIGEIRLFAFDFAPNDWANCYGQTIPVSQNTALFSLLGVNYGGDGQSTFGLPNYQGNAAAGPGQSPGNTDRAIGEVFGSESVALISSEMPAHTHGMTISQGSTGRSAGPVTGSALSQPGLTRAYLKNASVNTTLAPTAVSVVGSGVPHENRQPFLVLNYSIALQGVFPQRP